MADSLRQQIEAAFEEKSEAVRNLQLGLFADLKAALNAGEIRAAEPDPGTLTGWRVNTWVKKGILLGFRLGSIVDCSIDRQRQPWFDKDTYPVRRFDGSEGVRIVPGGSSIRDGCYIGRGVTCMPPMYINAGAYVDEGSMIDSHALVGSCAQVGRRCHISAAAQIGGVLEPVGALPVIIEDDVMVGGNCGIYEGTVVRERAVLGTGTILNRSTPVYDLVREQVYRATDEDPLVIPEGAVIVAGSRAVASGKGREWNISLYTPVIIKYRDERTQAKIQLEDLLRGEPGTK